MQGKEVSTPFAAKVYTGLARSCFCSILFTVRSNIRMLRTLSSTTRNCRGASVRNSSTSSVPLGTVLAAGGSVVGVWFGIRAPEAVGPKETKCCVDPRCDDANSNAASKENIDPTPGVLSKAIVPPILSTKVLTIDKPRPIPLSCPSAPRWNGSNTFATCRGVFHIN
jgi:hypothetical protein